MRIATSNGNGHHNGNGNGHHSSVSKRTTSAARVEANRRNARKSTGPRTEAGKRRASMNALKHGVCANSPLLPGECGTTFNTFAEEVRADLRPRTPVERTLVVHITNALWRLERIGDVERAVLRIERERIEGKAKKPAKMKLPPRLAALEDEAGGNGDGPEAMWPCEVIARCFAGEDPQKSPLLLLQRYERSLHNTVMRLMARLDVLKRRDHAALYEPTELELRGERPRRAPPRPPPAPAPAPREQTPPAWNEPVQGHAKPQAASGQAGSAAQGDDAGRRNEPNAARAAGSLARSPVLRQRVGEGRGEGRSLPRITGFQPVSSEGRLEKP